MLLRGVNIFSLLLTSFSGISFNNDLTIPAHIYLFEVNNRNTKKDAKYVQRYQERHKSHVNDRILVSLWLTLNIFNTFF